MVRRLAYLAGAVLVVALAAQPGAQESRSIALILDASGSMNAKLATGGTRIDAAKAAVAAFVAKLDPNIRIGYRVYGHQSPTSARNCKDTELMVDFGPASANRDAILAKTQTVKAQGYTPITYVIELAARDIAKEPGSRTIVLVSDGKETCPGDPCAAAKALAEADASLVIHTIGFNVDAAARFQLQCMARVGARHLFGCDRRRRSRRPPRRGRRRETGAAAEADQDRDHHHQAEARPAADQESGFSRPPGDRGGERQGVWHLPQHDVHGPACRHLQRGVRPDGVAQRRDPPRRNHDARARRARGARRIAYGSQGARLGNRRGGRPGLGLHPPAQCHALDLHGDVRQRPLGQHRGQGRRAQGAQSGRHRRQWRQRRRSRACARRTAPWSAKSRPSSRACRCRPASTRSRSRARRSRSTWRKASRWRSM